jgi:hypothetical protein
MMRRVIISESKKDYKFATDKRAALPFSAFKDGSEVLIKWKAAIIEESPMNFALGRVNGLTAVGWPDLKLVGTRLAFIECSPEVLTSPAHFHVTITARNITLINAMIFVRSEGKVFCLYRQKVGLYLPLENSCFNKLNQAVHAADHT